MILAMAGHVDHGKTALIRALTGVDADRLPEEKKRGMTIDLGFAHLRLASGETVGFVDVPGHQRFMSNMLAGVLSIDTVLLVVAADDGPMPQTREHLAIARLTGVPDIAAVITKIDRVDAARLATATASVRDLLTAAGYPDAPVMNVSSLTGAGVPAVLDFIAGRVARAGMARADVARAGFRLAVDRSFSPPGAGLVVTGTIAAGAVAPGDRLMLSPSRLAARVRGIQVYNEGVTGARAGDRCALAIAGSRVEQARLRRGDWLIDPALHAPTQRIDALLRAAEDTGPRHASRVHVHYGAASVLGRALMARGRDLAPDDVGFVTLFLDRPAACLHGDRVILRDDSTGRVVAGGHVVDPFSPERRVRREQRASSLAAHAIADPGDAFRALLAAEGWADRRRFILARNLPADFAPEVDAAAIRVGPAAAPVLVSPATVAQLEEGFSRFLAAGHAARPDSMGPGKAALLRAAGPVPDTIAEAVLEAMRARGDLTRDGLAWRLPGHRPVLAPLDEAAWPGIEAALEAGGMRPPRVRELALELGYAPDAMQGLMLRLERFGRVAGVAANRFFLPETIVVLGEVAQALTAASDEAGFTAAEFNKRTGIGRNLTIELLEYLDKIGVTQRVGDLRHVVRPVGEAMH